MSDPTIPPASSSVASAVGTLQQHDASQRSAAMLAHVLGIFSILGPGIFYLVKKSDPRAGGFVMDQIKESFNFQLAVFVAYVALVILMIVLGSISGTLATLVGFAIGLGALAALVLLIMAAMKANKGEAPRYPFKIPALK